MNQVRALCCTLLLCSPLACTIPQTVALEDYGTEYYRMYCRANWQCAETAGWLGEELRYSSLEECLADAPNQPLYAQEIEAAQAGRIVFDAQKAHQCLQEMEEKYCSEFPEFPDVCREVFTGQVDEGEPCLVGTECSGDAYCRNSFVDEACYGRCVLNNRCGPDVCDDDEYCAKDSWGEPTGCQPRRAEGADCQSGPCADGLYCNGESRTCTRRADRGEACADYHGCKSGLRCLSGICAQQEPTLFTLASEGEPCNGDEETYCTPGLICSGIDESTRDGLCAPFAAVDAPCARTRECHAGLYCAETHTCQPLRPDGADCEVYYQCASGSCTPSSREGEEAPPICSARPECTLP